MDDDNATLLEANWDEVQSHKWNQEHDCAIEHCQAIHIGYFKTRRTLKGAGHGMGSVTIMCVKNAIVLR